MATRTKTNVKLLSQKKYRELETNLINWAHDNAIGPGALVVGLMCVVIDTLDTSDVSQAEYNSFCKEVYKKYVTDVKASVRGMN